MTTAEIKTQALESIQEEMGGASTISLIKMARRLYDQGKEYDDRGDLKAALSAYVKATSLINEADRDGSVVHEDFEDIKPMLKDLLSRTGLVEDKLKATEVQTLRDSRREAGGAGSEVRMRPLILPSSVPSLERLPFGSKLPPVPAIAPASTNGFVKTMANMTTAEIKSHALESVQRDSRGATTISLIKTARRLYDQGKEYDARSDLKAALSAYVKAACLIKGATESTEMQAEKSSGAVHKEFNDFRPTLNDLISRTKIVEEKLKATEVQTSSAGDGPIHKYGGSLADRLQALRDTGLAVNTTSKRLSLQHSSPVQLPSSPSRTVRRSSSTYPLPNGYSRHASPLLYGAPLINSKPVGNSLFPKDIMGLSTGARLLLIDVRDRADFQREHIKRDAVICIEPKILRRKSINATSLMEALIISPPTEVSFFANREKFDYVVLYDWNSTSFGPLDSPLSVLMQTIYEREFTRMLKHAPIILVGGLEAWKKEFGEAEVTKGDGEVTKPPPPSTSTETFALATSTPQPSAKNPFANGTIPSALSSSSGGANSTEQHQVWTPARSRADTNPSNNYIREHRPTYSLDQAYNHVRSPAEVPQPSAKNPFANGAIPSALSSSSGGANSAEQHQVWAAARPRADTNPTNNYIREHRPTYSLDQAYNHVRSPAEVTYPSRPQPSEGPSQLVRRPTLSRPAPCPSLPSTRIADSFASPPMSPSISGFNGIPPTNGMPPVPYPNFPRHISPASPQPFLPDIASPPQASINSSLSRRRSDYIDQTQEVLAGLHGSQRGDLATIIRHPPAAASSALERHDDQPRIGGQQSFSSPTTILTPQTGAIVQSPSLPAHTNSLSYWSDVQIGMSGLKNLGNTGYMNAPIQCLSATVPFARFFTDGRWKHDINKYNKLGTNGKLSGAFAKVLYDMWGQDLPYLTPMDFRRTIAQLQPRYAGTEQHDSQDFLSFLLDGIHEDLNRVTLKPPAVMLTPQEEAEMEKLPACIASDREWSRWMSRNNSVIADYFQGQFRNQLQCMTCSTTSTTYNVFSILQLPIPSGERVTLQQCLDALLNEEILETDDAWDCPKCKTKRKALKKLSLARSPPILLIHLKRVEANGRFLDKIDTFVEFPLKDLDMTSRMPLPPHNEALLNGGVVMSPSDPRRQISPYKYDLYGVTNHTGHSSSGHYTALVRSSGRWYYCDDSSIKTVDDRDVVSQKAYVLFYKRKA